MTLDVEVRTGGLAAVADLGDHCARRHVLADLHQRPVDVAVDGDRAVGVLHPHPQAEAAGGAGADHRAGEGDVDRGADRGRDVQSLVERTPTAAEAGRDRSGEDLDAARSGRPGATERRGDDGGAGRRSGARGLGGGSLLQLGGLDERRGVGDAGLGWNGGDRGRARSGRGQAHRVVEAHPQRGRAFGDGRKRAGQRLLAGRSQCSTGDQRRDSANRGRDDVR